MTKEEIIKSLADGWVGGMTPGDEERIVYPAMEIYSKQIAIEFLNWATERNLQLSLGVLVDNEGTYENIETYYSLFLEQYKHK